jgi:hypothetical protein
MKRAFFSPRIFFISSVIVIVTLTAIGWSFWTLAAAQYRRVIDGYIEGGRAAGYQITYDDRQIFGFPRRITMRLMNVHWRDADGIDFHTDDMDITVTPWMWSTFDAKFKSHVVVAAPLDDKDHSLLMAGSEGRAHIKLDADGFWKVANLALDDAKIGLAPNYLFEADRLKVDITRPPNPPKDHKEAGLSVDGEADTITIPSSMPSPFGTKAQKLSAHMRVMGPVPDVRERASVDAWNKDSGIVEFDDFSMQWGVLSLESKGTIGFDDDLQPEGAFAGTVANPQKTFEALKSGGFIAMHDADMLDAVTDMFAKPSTKNQHGMELPITIQLGGLFFGPIRIFTFPEIEWPLAPPPIDTGK